MDTNETKTLTKLIDEYGVINVINEIANILESKYNIDQGIYFAKGWYIHDEESLVVIKNLRHDLY